MEFRQGLQEAILSRRHNRFLVDATLSPAEKRMVYCINDGCLRGCDTLGSRIWFSEQQQYPGQYVWELVEVGGGNLAAVNQALSSVLVLEGIQSGLLASLKYYGSYALTGDGEHLLESLELMCTGPQGTCFVGIEDITWVDEIGRGFFPDGISPKAAGRLRSLIKKAHQGHRTVLCFCVKHTGAKSVWIPEHMDPQYAALLDDAQKAGVELMAWRTQISVHYMRLEAAIPLQRTS